MAGEIFFDNSALSRFVDETDADRRTMLDALRRLGTPRISELNVMETARTTDLAVRKRKLEIYKELTGTFAPMNEPVELLAKLANAHLNRSGFKAGSQYAYHLLAHPADASDQLQRALTEWAADQETRFRSLHETMRTHFSGPFEGEATEVMTNEKAFLKYVFENANSILAGLVTGFYRDATGNDLPPAQVSSFLDDVPAWKTFIAAHLHSLWVRSIKTKGPEKRSAGIVDTDSAVYLNFCDRFITHDRAQFEVLMIANEFNPRETTVELYSDFRAELLR